MSKNCVASISALKSKHKIMFDFVGTVEPLSRGHPDEMPTPLERPLNNIDLNMKDLISTPDERQPLFKGHIYRAKAIFVICRVNYAWEEKKGWLHKRGYPVF